MNCWYIQHDKWMRNRRLKISVKPRLPKTPLRVRECGATELWGLDSRWIRPEPASSFKNQVMKVKNINGIGDKVCPCGNWLNHWIRFSKAKQAGLCKELTCTEFATEGVLVQKADSSDKEWYVVPLCDIHCRMTGKEIELLGRPELVAAKIDKACGK